MPLKSCFVSYYQDWPPRLDFGFNVKSNLAPVKHLVPPVRLANETNPAVGTFKQKSDETFSTEALGHRSLPFP